MKQSNSRPLTWLGDKPHVYCLTPGAAFPACDIILLAPHLLGALASPESSR